MSKFNSRNFTPFHPPIFLINYIHYFTNSANEEWYFSLKEETGLMLRHIRMKF